MQKKHDEDRELTYDELDRITSEEEEELESSDSECSCDWEEYTDDEDVVCFCYSIFTLYFSLFGIDERCASLICTRTMCVVGCAGFGLSQIRPVMPRKFDFGDL